MQLYGIGFAQIDLIIAAQLLFHATQDHGGFHHRQLLPLNIKMERISDGICRTHIAPSATSQQNSLQIETLGAAQIRLPA